MQDKFYLKEMGQWFDDFKGSLPHMAFFKVLGHQKKQAIRSAEFQPVTLSQIRQLPNRK